MGRRLRWLLGIGAVLAAAYGAMMVTWPDAHPPLQTHARRGSDGPHDRIPATEHKVAVTIPAQTEGSDIRGCPQSSVGTILGVTISRPHGCLVGGVAPGGPGEAAGLKVGDSIVACQGEPVSCPSGLLPHVRPAGEEREVELTVRRRERSGTAEGAGG